MTNRQLTILLTGVGAPGVRGTLWCLRENPNRRPVRAIGVDISRDAAGRWLVDTFESVPAPEHEEYWPTILDLCRRHDVDLVLPQTTREVARLSLVPHATNHPPVVLAGSAEAVRRANDKLETLKAFEAAGLPVPLYSSARTVEEVEDVARKIGYPDSPVVVKLPVSNGGRGLRILRDRGLTFDRFVAEKPSAESMRLDDFLAMCRAASSIPTLLVSEYLPGDEYTVDAFRGRHIQIAVPRRRTTIRSGITFVADVELDADMTEQTLLGAASLGLEGVFGFQFRRNSHGQPLVLECNPRVQGTMVASALAGANVVWMAIMEALGEPIHETPTIRWGTRFIRYWGGLGLRGDSAIEI